MSCNCESGRRLAFCIFTLLLWFVNLAIFTHHSQSFGDAALGALIVSGIISFFLGLIILP